MIIKMRDKNKKKNSHKRGEASLDKIKEKQNKMKKIASQKHKAAP